MSTGYACKVCGAPVAVTSGELSRSCGHGGTVTASMSATAYGAGSMAHGTTFERLMHRVLKALGARR